MGLINQATNVQVVPVSGGISANETTCKSFIPTTDNTRELRRALGCFGTGVTIITIQLPNGPFGMTVNSFSSVSLDPPLILWSVDKRSERCKYFEQADHFAVNVLRQDQEQQARLFASNPSAFTIDNHEMGKHHSPLLKQCLATFECKREVLYSGGDHTIIIGRVLQAAAGEGSPLMFYKGVMGGFSH